MIKSQQNIKRINNFSSHTEFIEYEKIVDNLILNNHGDIIGMITDLYFNEKDGYITAFEITEGYIDDIVSGRKIINSHNEYQLIPNYQYKQHVDKNNYFEH
jgi:uncharacterized protein YrrD